MLENQVACNSGASLSEFLGYKHKAEVAPNLEYSRLVPKQGVFKRSCRGGDLMTPEAPNNPAEPSFSQPPHEHTNHRSCCRRSFWYKSCTTTEGRSSWPPDTAIPVLKPYYQKTKENPASRRRRPFSQAAQITEILERKIASCL